jgi:hypothetical protein
MMACKEVIRGEETGTISPISPFLSASIKNKEPAGNDEKTLSTFQFCIKIRTLTLLPLL